MTRDWPLLTDEARRLRREIEERAWAGQPTQVQEQQLSRIKRSILDGERYVIPF